MAHMRTKHELFLGESILRSRSEFDVHDVVGRSDLKVATMDRAEHGRIGVRYDELYFVPVLVPSHLR